MLGFLLNSSVSPLCVQRVRPLCRWRSVRTEWTCSLCPRPSSRAASPTLKSSWCVRRWRRPCVCVCTVLETPALSACRRSNCSASPRSAAPPRPPSTTPSCPQRTRSRKPGTRLCPNTLISHHDSICSTSALSERPHVRDLILTRSSSSCFVNSQMLCKNVVFFLGSVSAGCVCCTTAWLTSLIWRRWWRARLRRRRTCCRRVRRCSCLRTAACTRPTSRLCWWRSASSPHASASNSSTSCCGTAPPRAPTSPVRACYSPLTSLLFTYRIKPRGSTLYSLVFD